MGRGLATFRIGVVLAPRGEGCAIAPRGEGDSMLHFWVGNEARERVYAAWHRPSGRGGAVRMHMCVCVCVWCVQV